MRKRNAKKVRAGVRTAEGEGKERKEENEDKSWGQTDREGRS